MPEDLCEFDRDVDIERIKGDHQRARYLHPSACLHLVTTALHISDIQMAVHTILVHVSRTII